VHSVSPDKFDLLGDALQGIQAPVYIVGGGKTGMDTAYALLTRMPQKRVKMLIGEGTMFGSRDLLYPSGLRRYWQGVTPVATFLDLAERFDGYNEHEVLERLRSHYTVSLVPDARRFMLGLLSEHENSVIKNGADEIIKDYFVDVVDRAGAPTLMLRSGESRAIEPGSFIVNCTGYLFRDDVPYEPFVSASGKVVSIQTSSAINVLSTNAAYLATHLSYLGKLQSLPLYEIDLGALHRKNRDVVGAIIGPLVLYNAGLVLQNVPRYVLDEFGTDLESWFPLPRRLYDLVTLMRHYKQKPDHMQRSLDVVRERFGVRCGPLSHATPDKARSAA
jgi:hypothetical protein